MESRFRFEICAVNIQSAMAAQEAAAHRIELCSALDAGGITPSAGLIQSVLESINIPVNVLIRPREGGFCYSEKELDIMLKDIAFCRRAGVHGVVVGALTPEWELDIPKLSVIREAASGLEMVHHRAFDFCKSPFLAIEQLIDLGFTRVLSSGQANSAYEGRDLLQELVERARGRISVMPGAGINKNNIAAIASVTGATEFHFTGKKQVTSHKIRPISGLEESYWQSDIHEIKEIIQAVSE